jgi:hypothetical protein
MFRGVEVQWIGVACSCDESLNNGVFGTTNVGTVYFRKLNRPDFTHTTRLV